VSAKVLAGRATARAIRAQLKERVARLGFAPRLDVIVASQDPASLAYVAMKKRWAELAGIESRDYPVDGATSQGELIGLIHRLNADPDVHGVLIQHPLPGHLDEGAALTALGPEKDVDGISPQSLGRLTAGLPGFRCATPLGILRLLDEYGIALEGRRAVVVGRSVILGKPAALMLLERHCTVTIAHSRTRDLPELCRTAEVLVVAVGRPEMVRGDWIREGAAVIDAGYNKIAGRPHDVGDCHFEECARRAAWITPVPGGVGPMTVASLLGNVVDAAEQAAP
jgi:methylenetetrahydrofolate dehydrogenase (NADP+)/methenyltetrahydrofolate cyclohydrolase